MPRCVVSGKLSARAASACYSPPFDIQIQSPALIGTPECYGTDSINQKMCFAVPDNVEQLRFETNRSIAMWNSFCGTE